MAFVDLNLKENDIKLAVVSNGDGTYSLVVTTVSGSGITINPDTVIAGAKSGIATVTASGTEVQLHSNLALNCAVAVKAKTTNTGIMYVGNDGTDHVDSTTGFGLAAGDGIVFNRVSNLNKIWVDASVSGESVKWIALDI